MILKTASLPDLILRVIKSKGTERPFSGEYDDFEEIGTYLCRQCGLALFRSTSKFHSGCGWPSFEEELPNAIERIQDQDGQRTEIVCRRCGAHLGHVFQGEGFTPKNTRHCVNSLSLDFVNDLQVLDTEEAIFAAGCFWGVEHLFKKLNGVVKTQVGYSGGVTIAPTYDNICGGGTGHYEVVRILFDPSKISYEDVVKYFFEIHDFTQTNGQGPDIGKQYESVIFYYNEDQKEIASHIIDQLIQRHFKVATKLLPVAPFWPAEKYHQDYYQQTGKQPYCHHHQKIF